MWETQAMNRWARRSIVLALVAGAFGASGCGGSGGNGAATVTPVVRAAYVTAREPGYRFDLTFDMSFAGHSVTISGTGSIDERDQQGTMSIQAGGQTLTVLLQKPYIYTQVPAGSATSVTHGKRWLRANVDVYSRALGGSNPFGSSDVGAKQMLGFLKSSGQVSDLGSQTIGGVATTRYHALVDFGRYAATVAPAQRAAAQRYADTLQRITGRSSLPIDVWVDAQQRVRRISVQMQMCTKQGRLNESMTMNLYDYGHQPAVGKPPPASEVTDITGELRSQISKGLSQLAC
jgi:hypothetical protein